MGAANRRRTGAGTAIPEPARILDFLPRTSPHPPGRGSPGEGPDEGTRRMCEILVDMALRRLLARAAGGGAAKGR